MQNGIPLRFKDAIYMVEADFDLIRDIEQELGGIAHLKERFALSGWMISELVTLTQMMLQAAGRTVDYVELGNQMLRDGLDRYLVSARLFLQDLIQG